MMQARHFFCFRRPWRSLVCVTGILVIGRALLSSAAAAPTNSTDLVWPPPPEPPRIRFVENLARPTDFGFKQSALRRFSNWLFGSQKGDVPFQAPFAIALDESGNLALTDMAFATVGCYERKEKKWYQWQEIGGVRFRSPVGVAKHGRTIFVADSELGVVLAFDLKARLQFIIDAPLKRPVGLCVTGDHLCVADPGLQAVCVFNLKGEFLFQFGRKGVGPGEFNYPTHVAADAAGKLYVTDALNGRIQVFDEQGKFQNTIGVLGDGLGCLSRPKGVAVNQLGHVYVADGLKDSLQIYSTQNQFLLVLGGSGANAGQFCMPSGVAAGTNCLVYVADSGNHRIQVFQYIGSP